MEDSGSLRCARVVSPQIKCVPERTQAESGCVGRRNIPQFGLPLFNPLVSAVAGGQKRCGANDSAGKPPPTHTSPTSSVGANFASNGYRRREASNVVSPEEVSR